jgi:hypothetical protein
MEDDDSNNALVKFILDYFRVDSLQKVNPFAGFSVPAYEAAREVTKNVHFKGSGTLLIQGGDFQPRKPYNGLQYNLNDVSVRTMLVRYIKNPSPQKIYICKIFEPISGQKEAEAINKMLEAVGAPRGCAIEMEPNKEGQFNTFLIKENPQCIYLNEAFIRTYMHLDQQNIMNGTIKIPPEVCAQANLPKECGVFNEQGETSVFQADYYVLIPNGHVLTWCLNIGSHRRLQKGMFALELTTNNKIMYFIVPNVTFDAILKSCIENFMTEKIDRRPLNQVGINVVGGYAEVDMSMTFICFPNIQDRSKLIPIMPPEFPRYVFNK